MTEGAWWERAACRDAPIDWFFPAPGGSVSRARELCADCRVTVECLELALKIPGYCDSGIWAGTSAQQRRRLRHQVR